MDNNEFFSSSEEFLQLDNEEKRKNQAKISDSEPMLDRKGRFEKRHKKINGNLNLNKLKVIALKVDGKVEESVINYGGMRKNSKDVLVDELVDISQKYKLPYSKLKWRTRMDRIDTVTKENCCNVC